MLTHQRKAGSLADIASRFGSKRYIQITWLDDHNKTIFVSNPKCGCSAVKHFLAEHSDSFDVDKRNIHNRTPTEAQKLRLAVSSKLELSEFEIFTTVRHPVERCVSAYVDKMSRNCSQRREVNLLLGKTEHHIPDWEDFFSVLMTISPIQLNAHWRPQYLNLALGFVEYNKIFKIETESSLLLDYLNTRLKVDEQELPKKNVKSSLIGATKPKISNKQLKELKKLYVIDYLKFSYLSWSDAISLAPEWIKYKLSPLWFAHTPVRERTFSNLITSLFKVTVGRVKALLSSRKSRKLD